jgi:hypothetical protein
MSTLPAVFAMVVVLPALGIGITVWWMVVSPWYRPNTITVSERSNRLIMRVLLGLLMLGLVVFGPVAQLLGIIWFDA